MRPTAMATAGNMLSMPGAQAAQADKIDDAPIRRQGRAEYKGQRRTRHRTDRAHFHARLDVSWALDVSLATRRITGAMTYHGPRA